MCACQIFAFFKFLSPILGCIPRTLVLNRESIYFLFPSLSLSRSLSLRRAVIERVHSFLFLLSRLHHRLPERCCHLFRENFARHGVHLCECARARHHVCTLRTRAIPSRGIRGITRTFLVRRVGNASKYPMIFQRKSRFVIQHEYGSVKFSKARLQVRHSDITICRVDNQLASYSK